MAIRKDELPQRTKLDPAATGFLEYGRFVVVTGQAYRGVQACCDPFHRSLGDGLGEGLHERIASSPVQRSHPAKMPVQFAAIEELPERILVDPGGPSIGEELLLGNGF